MAVLVRVPDVDEVAGGEDQIWPRRHRRELHHAALEVAGGRLPWRGERAGEVEVLFRPESVTLVESGEESLTGRVLSSFFLGDRTRLVVEGVGRTPIVVETVASREFKAGQSVHLKIDPDALLVLDR